MGHIKEFVDRRVQETQKKTFDDRKKRAGQEKDKRRGTTGAPGAARKVTSSQNVRIIPNESEAKGLIDQLYQTCRVPSASDSICNLIRHLTERLFTTKDTPTTTSQEALEYLKPNPSGDGKIAAAATSAKKRAREAVREDGETVAAQRAQMLKRLKKLVAAFVSLGQETVDEQAEKEELQDGEVLLGDDAGANRIANIIIDESGNRVMCTLLRCLLSAGSADEEDVVATEAATEEEGEEKKRRTEISRVDMTKKRKEEEGKKAAAEFSALMQEDIQGLVQMVLYCFDCGAIAKDQNTAIRVLAVIADHGSDENRKVILKLIRKNAESPIDVITDKHVSNVVLKLLEKYRTKTVAWLNSQLLVSKAAASPVSKKGGKKAAAVAEEEETSTVGKITNAKELLDLIDNPMAGNLLQSWVDDSNREELFFGLLDSRAHLLTLLASKRGNRFLTRILSVGSTTSGADSEGAEAGIPAFGDITTETSNLAQRMLHRMLYPGGTAVVASTETEDEETIAANVAMTKKLNLVRMSMDKQSNYVAQKVFGLIPYVAKHQEKEAMALYKRLQEIFDEHDATEGGRAAAERHAAFTARQEERRLKGYSQHVGGYHNRPATLATRPTHAINELALSTVGCHSVNALVSAIVGANIVVADTKGSRPLDVNPILDHIFKQPAMTQALLADKSGSLVIRHLLKIATATSVTAAVPALATALLKSIDHSAEQAMHTLMFDASGNLLVQDLLLAHSKNVTDPHRYSLMFLQKHIISTNSGDASGLMNVARNPYASHVLFTLLDVLPAKAHMELCKLVKPHVELLTVHLNGRFVVEKLVASSADIREVLVRCFAKLAKEKGTQHVLLTLWDALDERAAKDLLHNTLLPAVKDLSCNASGSIVVQKMIQDSQQRHEQATRNNLPTNVKATMCLSVERYLNKIDGLKATLLKDFFGKFVVQVLTSSAQPIESSDE
eukprot:TRINITY_DN532_c0_g1_i7.p1 TRINITY_DN532_c0_g1~~TRINITY_DN532_c0_g1_i7.p1  ORF type:complete len:955 (-),score=437.06 TRINITY_DN532_c0_g1_i7:274-3138(-)